MEISEEADLTAVDGENGDLVNEEEGEEEVQFIGPSDVLLEMSEENWFKEWEPLEYHCYSGWEDAVYGWTRVAPLSCILLNAKKCNKQKHKEADNPTPPPAEPMPSDAGSSASIAEQSCESRVGLQKVKKSMLSKQQKGPGSQTPASAQQSDAAEWADFSAVQRNMAHLSIAEKTGEECALRETPSQPDCPSFKYTVPAIRLAKLHKHSHRPSDTVLPIKSIIFLPPIKSPQLSHKKAPGGEIFEEDCLTLNRKGGRRGTRVDVVSKSHLHAYSTGLSSKYQTSQLNPRFFSAPSVSVPRRYRVPVSFKAETVHQTSYTMGNSISQAITQPHMHPSCLFS